MLLKLQSDICSNCGKSKYKCLTSSIYGSKKSVCPFCNTSYEEVESSPETKEKCILSKAERELRDSLSEPNIVTSLGYEADEKCLLCAERVEYGFQRVKLPNCEHLLHKDCFENYWRHIIYYKYQLEDQSTFEKNCNVYTCQKCGSDVGLHFITYTYPWPQIIKKMVKTLENNKSTQIESMKSNPIKMKCCKTKTTVLEIRESFYTSLETRRMYVINCKTCARVIECPLKKFLISTEIRIITRMVCSKCKEVCLPFAFNRDGHSICRKCFHTTKDHRYHDVFSGKAKISIT
jgi:hypothetical protein